MTYCAARSAGSLRSCSPDPWGALRHGIRPMVPPMNAYIMLSMDCAYTDSFTRFVCHLESNYKLKGPQYKVVSRGKSLFIFVSTENSSSGDVETFIFWLSPRETRVERTPFQNVASGHAPLIRLLHWFYFNSCAGLKIKYPSVIKTMFPLHGCSSCIYLFCLGERRVESILGKVVEVGQEKLEKQEKNAFELFLGLIVSSQNVPDGSLFTPWGRGPCGFDSAILVLDCS